MSSILDSALDRARLDVIAENEAAMGISASCEWPPVRFETPNQYAKRRAEENIRQALALDRQMADVRRVL